MKLRACFKIPSFVAADVSRLSSRLVFREIGADLRPLLRYFKQALRPLLLSGWIVLCLPALLSAPAALPLPIAYTNTAVYRWLSKPVLESRLVDDMEQTNHWSHHGRGAMTFSTQRTKDGRQSILLTSLTIPEKPSRITGRPFGEAIVRRTFAQEDWTPFNRISFWVYPDLPGFKVVSMMVRLANTGSERLSYTAGAMHFFLLQNYQWNQVAWEIPHLTRDKVTGLDFVYRMQGNEPSATNQVRFHLDRLELQRVNADHFEGWNVAPGQIAYSHSGYPIEGTKIALSSGLKATNFILVAEDSGRKETRPVKPVRTELGEFQVLDFSDAREAGTYRLQAGLVTTPPFRIGDDVWRDSIGKTINFFYGERCGDAIPGVHDVCHQDWQAAHGNRRLVINGGWHDAGDLSQGLVNTAEATYAMLDLANVGQASRLSGVDEKPGGDTEAKTAAQSGTGGAPVLRASETGETPVLRALLAEARWGLAWLLKTRFGDGYRVTWATMDYWTDGQLGSADDTVSNVNNSAFDNFLAAATEAKAARVLKASDSALAEKALQAAREDWQFAVEKAAKPSLETVAAGAQASLDLYLATREPRYGDKAIEWADFIVRCQQREYPDWRVPLTGFFYTSTNRDRLLHYNHRSHEQAPVVALAGLCEALPDHTNWMKWYSTVVLYAEYLKRVAQFNQPYGVLPASIYRTDERPDQVARGIPLDERHFLRRFPVWDDFRGNFGVLLSQTKALAAAARLRGDPAGVDLCHRQLQWVVGLNPFAESTMFGEGHGYAPQYTAMSGDLVGSLPVGIQTRGPADQPYWPSSNCYNYKEVWVHPSSRWLAIQRDLANAPLRRSRAALIQEVSQDTSADGQVNIRIRVQGSGRHQFAMRASNLELSSSAQTVELAGGKLETLTWKAKTVSPKELWVAVVIPDGQPQQGRDLVGNLK